jgi:hypothetical protein
VLNAGAARARATEVMSIALSVVKDPLPEEGGKPADPSHALIEQIAERSARGLAAFWSRAFATLLQLEHPNPRPILTRARELRRCLAEPAHGLQNEHVAHSPDPANQAQMLTPALMNCRSLVSL